MNSLHYQVLIQVSLGYPCVRGRLPTRYSPVRRYPAKTSSEPSVSTFSLDLHVLGTPPAFILSQDQTLNKMISKALIILTRALNLSLSYLLILNDLRRL